MKLFSFLSKKFHHKDESFVDNNSSLNYEKAIPEIRKAFAKKIPFHRSYIQDQYYDPHGYWGITFLYNGVDIFMGESRSFIDYRLTINKEEIRLSDFDDVVLKIERASEKNFILLVDVMSRYLVQHSTSIE